jgi:E3 ubiquitin-protein ligase HUWE1
MIPEKLITIFSENELELLISGLPTVDIADLQAHTQYRDFKGDATAEQRVKWFWEFAHSLTPEERPLLIQFVTGTSRVPVGGFGNTPFQIERISGLDRLPSAHTCFNTLDLPDYTSFEKLRQCFKWALRDCEGFGFI